MLLMIILQNRHISARSSLASYREDKSQGEGIYTEGFCNVRGCFSRFASNIVMKSTVTTKCRRLYHALNFGCQAFFDCRYHY